MNIRRAIIVDVMLKDGSRRRVVFDRHGQNSDLFAEAIRGEWDHDRTVGQAVSNALAPVLRQNVGAVIREYNVNVI
jgi:hypothetical protein